MFKYQVLESFAGFDDFLLYLGMSLVLLAVFSAIYIRITPYREFALIREGNMAAAFSFSGTYLGFVAPLAAAVKYSVNPIDMAIWGVVALVIQIFAYLVCRMLFPTVTVDIPAGKQSTGFVLGIMSLGVGLLNSACMAY
jgi:putative membrane protein